jgi:hypothetical protein
MGRYHILLNKIPEIPPEENVKVHQFGFEQDFQSRYKETQKKQRLFHLNGDERARIGIVHEEGRKDIFSGSAIHFHGRRRFFCKSTSHRTALCCSSTYSGNHPTLRVAVPVIRYSQLSQTANIYQDYEIMPWVFEKIIFSRIKEMNDIQPVDQFDLFVFTRTSNNPFNQYDIQSAGNSLWRQRNDTGLILQSANSLRQNMTLYLAEDLDENAIETLLGQPPTTWQERPAPQRQRYVEGDFWDAVGRNPAPEPENTWPQPRTQRERQEPESDPSRDIDLDNVLDSI